MAWDAVRGILIHLLSTSCPPHAYIHHNTLQCYTKCSLDMVERGWEAVAILTAFSSRSPLLTPSLPSPSSLGPSHAKEEGREGEKKEEGREASGVA